MSNNRKIDISVLIVNYKTAKLAEACINALLAQKAVAYEVIVVDNHSQDDSAAVLSHFGNQIKLILNQENIGFGRANNQAFRESAGRYILMLNPDAMCLSEYDLVQAIKWLDAHPHIGLAGTRIVNQDNEPEDTVFAYYPRQREAGVFFDDLPGKIATVLGASMLARREVFEQVNGFDEDFFLYGEETDLCLRIRQAGFAIGYCDQVTVKHLGGASERAAPKEAVLRRKRAGKLLFYRKHYPLAVVRHMMRADLRYANFHLRRLWFIQFFKKLPPKQQQKMLNLRVVKELAEAFLAESGKSC